MATFANVLLGVLDTIVHHAQMYAQIQHVILMGFVQMLVEKLLAHAIQITLVILVKLNFHVVKLHV